MASCIASSSSSPPSSSNWRYDVFLSFRGEDTRKGFTGHLYEALKSAGFNTFIDDDELARGENITTELLEAIGRSKVSVIVFSNRYGDSRWCLEELVRIMQCRKTIRQKVYPIFYDVDPSDVRKQTGPFADPFKGHEERFASDLDMVKRWREALNEAANLSGWDLRNTADGHEAKFIKTIIEEVSRELSNTNLSISLYAVGLHSRLEVMCTMLDIGSNDKTLMIGIWGMSGIGKTTLSKAIYNTFQHRFEGRSFVANVREYWDKLSDRVRLQEKLLSDILKREVKVGSVDRGIVMIEERLRSRRVLVVIDDVDHITQLNAIARSRSWFGLGSRIIITTRDEHLLKQVEVDAVYKAKEMSEAESLELFSCHAFGVSCPSEEYSQLSKSVVDCCRGLPLALEVLGSFLAHRRTQEWTSVIEKLQRIPHKEIKDKLRICYDGLDDEEAKEIFLDISCFFVGMDKDYVAQILDACGLYADIGICILLERSLVTVSLRNQLMMHDLLRDMGRDIVRERFPKDPGERSRLWHHEDVFNVLRNHWGTKNVEGLTLNMEKNSKVSISTKAFENMRRLRLLQLNHVQLNGSYEYLSKELRWLCWHGYPEKFVPDNFPQENLVAIDFQYSNLRQVWKNQKLLENLKILNLSHSYDLTHTPDFSKLPNLQQLILKYCEKLYEVHSSIGHLDQLVLADFEGCKDLEKLPKEFYKLKSLATLNLSGCSRFKYPDDGLGEMKSLATLYVENVGLSMPSSIVKLKNLEDLSIVGSRGPSANPLPSRFWLSCLVPSKLKSSFNWLSPSSITSLNLDRNITDDVIPEDFGGLSSLVRLTLKSNRLHGLPILSGLPKLKTLMLKNCPMLESIPDLPTNLIFFIAHNCFALKRLPNMSNMSRFQILSLHQCSPQLAEIPNLNKLPMYIYLGGDNISTDLKENILQKSLTKHEDGGVRGIALPGDDIPQWFDYVNEGSFVNFTMPKLIDSQLKGFVVCIVYSYVVRESRIVSRVHPGMITVVNYRSRQVGFFQVEQIAFPFALGTPHGDHLWLLNISNETIVKLMLEEGDLIKVNVHLDATYNVKKTGLFMLLDKYEREEMLEYFDVNEALDEELSDDARSEASTSYLPANEAFDEELFDDAARSEASTSYLPVE